MIAVLGLSRRALLVIGACALPLILTGLFVLHQKRNVGFLIKPTLRQRGAKRFGAKVFTCSSAIRDTCWLASAWIRSRRTGASGDLFDNGRLPMGHMHSDYLQIALERGVPTLAVWLILLGNLRAHVVATAASRAG